MKKRLLIIGVVLTMALVSACSGSVKQDANNAGNTGNTEAAVTEDVGLEEADKKAKEAVAEAEKEDEAAKEAALVAEFEKAQEAEAAAETEAKELEEAKNAEEKVTGEEAKNAEAKVSGEEAKNAEEEAKAAAEKAAKAFANITEISPAKKMYAKSGVNVRKGPNTEYDVIGHLSTNQEINVIGRDKAGWYLFEYKGEKVFVSDKYLLEQPIVIAATTDTSVAAVTPTPVAQPVAPQVVAPAGVLFIGDSRCVQMRDVSGGGGCSWICRNGAGYKWFSETAIPQADEIVGKGTKVVICLGVNDPGNVSNYAALANQKALEWAARGAKTYYVSVNPVWENPYTSEEQVTNFNASIVGQLAGIKWIDTHTYLSGVGYKLVDGLHYDDTTNLVVFQAIIGSL